ncbi:hypothetical protein SUDANB108_06431 [Streptomyces sp. enrichment culture]|uniref:hypothetical protein n=1 Tax=Streptomyces sp. enrichment culture TaxID=1795815 RepID=UPI003F5503A0
MPTRYGNGRYATPEGTRVGLRVHDDACVTEFVRASNAEAVAGGPYPETAGCFAPPAGHRTATVRASPVRTRRAGRGPGAAAR